ncbi:MAG: hypothetical protein F6K21_19895 [Symploca sp. SIO2D2]|nr:hypothetical protein [Symploca sp. SIO2D2]
MSLYILRFSSAISFSTRRLTVFIPKGLYTGVVGDRLLLILGIACVNRGMVLGGF